MGDKDGRSGLLGGAWGLLLGLLVAFLIVSWIAERRARDQAETRLFHLNQELRKEEAEGEARFERIEWLEKQLAKTRLLARTQNKLVKEVLKKRTKEESLQAPVPPRSRKCQEAVRLLNASFRRQGLADFRFFEISGILEKGKGLEGVDLALLGDGGITRGMVRAERLELVLDRSKGSLKMLFHQAQRFGRQGVEALEDPWEVSLEPREPKIMSLELGELCRLEGSWPVPPKIRRKKPEDLENRILWTKRLNSFLRRAFPKEGLRVHHLDRAEDLSFYGLDLLGYSEKGVLKSRYHAKRLEIWTDLDSNRVELRFFEGFFQDSGGKLVFPKAGFQRVSPALGRKKAERFLAGFCRRYRSGG